MLILIMMLLMIIKGQSVASRRSIMWYDREVLRIPVSKWILYLFIAIISTTALVYFSFSHPFLESDNRYLSINLSIYLTIYLCVLVWSVLYRSIMINIMGSYHLPFDSMSILYWFTYPSIYLLSLFRHYMFYIWKRYLRFKSLR